ncbi:glycosyltransferase [Flavobacterium sp. DG2-3]|uniref:glycosyltransferase n=1 Tax=Flavobacterium sp. DG2-3 TaxID=3068317 RepID=UPI00273FF964|nr:glycosyltransferase [Flavobacterium sp. DG2-3]MDP5200713.1 glycosyltransferase [Flavobacterium sp. DG2-3]
MIKVGFLLNFPLEYKGGINYFKNLFYAVDKFCSDKVKVILFVPKGISKEYIEMFSPYARIVETTILKRKSFPWLLSKIGSRVFGYDIITYSLLSRNKINAVSHSDFVFPSKKIKTLNWIPDFQYVHYPNLWTKTQLKATINLHKILIKKSDAIVLSSYAAFEDFKINNLENQEKVSVLNFVSQPNNDIQFSITDSEITEIKDLYNIERHFFYMPNQFWSHKNHLTVFEAIKLLKEKGHNPLVVTSGLMSDYRNGIDHVAKLLKYVEDNDLQKNILFLGLIPYHHVGKLILMCNCVINPSYFEGWSSTVEEAKTVGKKIILSNIPVHLEQNPKFGIYFNPDSPKELALKMEEINQNPTFCPEDEEELKRSLNSRTKDFANTYLKILNDLKCQI